MTTAEPTSSLNPVICVGCGSNAAGCQLKVAIRRRRCCGGCSHDNPSTSTIPTERETRT